MEIFQNIWTALTTKNENLIGIINIPLAFIEIYISMLIFTQLFKIETNRKCKLIYVITFATISCLSRFFIPDPYGSILNLIICPILIIFIFKTSILKAIISEFFPAIIESIISYFLLQIISMAFNISSNDAVYVPIYRLCSSLIEYLCMYLIYRLLKHFNIYFKSLDGTNKKTKSILILNLVFGIISIILQMYIIIYYLKDIPIWIVLATIISLCIYFIISIYSLYSTSKLNIAKQNLEETRLMNKTLTELNDKIRAFRHDFNNIIQALGGYIQAKDYTELERYYSQLLKDCQEVNNLTALNNETINNPAIYSLIASKYYLATSQNITFNIEVVMDLTTINMKIYEFCRILGILLDNAIQAAIECDKKKINVIIRNDTKNNRQLLVIENTYKDKNINTEKIYEKGFSTKEGNTGLGLWEVRQILSKNTNLNLFTSKNDTYFSQQLEIYNN